MPVKTTCGNRNHFLEDQNAAYDRVAKHVLSFKILLAWILKYCVEEFYHSSIEDIRDKYILGTPEVSSTPVDREGLSAIRISGETTEDSTLAEGTITYDIRFRAKTPGNEEIGLILNVEAQKSSRLPYPLMKRVMYYGSRLVSAQKGVEFSESDYGRIRKVYTIWICMDTPDGKSGIASYTTEENMIAGSVKQDRKSYDIVRAIMVYVGRDTDNVTNRLLRLLYLIFKANQTTAVKLEELKKDYEITFTQHEEKEVDRMCNLSYGIEERGYDRGVLAGTRKGRAEGQLFMMKTMMDTLHLTAEEVMDAGRIPEADRAVLRKKLLENR